jgi:predicted nucleotidyltransferase
VVLVGLYWNRWRSFAGYRGTFRYLRSAWARVVFVASAAAASSPFGKRYMQGAMVAMAKNAKIPQSISIKLSVDLTAIIDAFFFRVLIAVSP